MTSVKESKKNIQWLIDQGIPMDYINSFDYSSKLDVKERARILDAWNQKKASEKAAADAKAALDAATPDYLKNDPSFQALPDDLKQMAVYADSITRADDQKKAEQLAEAFEMAAAQADPYWKNVIRIAQDEVLRSFEEAQGDYQSSFDRLQRRIEEINQDLSANKEYLDLTQQQELASISGNLQDSVDAYNRNKQYYDADTAAQISRLEIDYNKQREDLTRNKEYLTSEEQYQLEKLDRDYSINKENLINVAASKGLTFSTKRDVAMERLNSEQEGMVESTRRQFGNQLAAVNADLAYAEKVKALSQGNIERENVMRQAEILAGLQTAQRKAGEQQTALQTEYAKRIADLEKEAARGNVEAETQIADLQRKLGESITGIGRAAETYLGTENMPALPGYEGLGDVPGQVYEEQAKDVAQRQEALYNELTGASLPV